MTRKYVGTFFGLRIYSDESIPPDQIRIEKDMSDYFDHPPILGFDGDRNEPYRPLSYRMGFSRWNIDASELKLPDLSEYRKEIEDKLIATFLLGDYPDYDPTASNMRQEPPEPPLNLEALEKAMSYLQSLNIPEWLYCEVDRFTNTDVLEMALSVGFKPMGFHTVEDFKRGEVEFLFMELGKTKLVFARVELTEARKKFVDMYRQGKISRDYLRYLIHRKGHKIAISLADLREILDNQP